MSESSYVSKIAFDSLQFLSYLHFCLVSLSFGHAGKNSEKNNRSACPCFLFKFLILPYSWHKTIKCYVIWGPSRWKPVIINRQVNRATPVVITHRCQALVSAVPASPPWSPSRVSEILLVLGLSGLRSCWSWVMYKWSTDKPCQNGAHLLLIIILSKLILNSSASQRQHQQKDHVFPSQGVPSVVEIFAWTEPAKTLLIYWPQTWLYKTLARLATCYVHVLVWSGPWDNTTLQGMSPPRRMSLYPFKSEAAAPQFQARISSTLLKDQSPSLRAYHIFYALMIQDFRKASIHSC